MKLQTSFISKPIFNPRTVEKGIKEILKNNPDLRGPNRLMKLYNEYQKLTGQNIKFTSLERYSRKFSN